MEWWVRWFRPRVYQSGWDLRQTLVFIWIWMQCNDTVNILGTRLGSSSLYRDKYGCINRPCYHLFAGGMNDSLLRSLSIISWPKHPQILWKVRIQFLTEWNEPTKQKESLFFLLIGKTREAGEKGPLHSICKEALERKRFHFPQRKLDLLSYFSRCSL